MQMNKWIDVIITDHHINGKKLPQAYAVINPYLNMECNIFQFIAGSSVSYKFIQYLYKSLNVDFPDYLEEFGLIVSALGSLSDRVSLKEPLNRLIVKYGVDFFIQSEREGIKALRDVSSDVAVEMKARNLTAEQLSLD